MVKHESQKVIVSLQWCQGSNAWKSQIVSCHSLWRFLSKFYTSKHSPYHSSVTENIYSIVSTGISHINIKMLVLYNVPSETSVASFIIGYHQLGGSGGGGKGRIKCIQCLKCIRGGAGVRAICLSTVRGWGGQISHTLTRAYWLQHFFFYVKSIREMFVYYVICFSIWGYSV